MEKLKYKTYSWDKEFEIKGYFSDDKTKVISNDCNSGTLSYSHGEIVLEIFGEFPNNDVISYDFGRPIDKIYGFDSSGKLLILESYGKPLGTDSTPGFPIRRYKIKNFKIFDIHYQWTSDGNTKDFGTQLVALINQLEDTKVQYYQFSFDHIEEWIGKSIVSAERDIEQSDFSINVNISDYKSTKVMIDSEGIIFEDAAGYNFLYENFYLEEFYKIKLSSQDELKLSLDKCYDISKKIKELIEILSDIPLSFINIEFLIEKRLDNNWPIITGKYFVQHSRKQSSWDRHKLHHISLAKLHDNFYVILNNWFNKSEKLEFIVREYSANLHALQYLEDQFIDSIRNLEVYARNFRSKVNNQNDDIEDKEKQKIFAFINSNIDKKFQSKFRKRLSFKRKDNNLKEKLMNLFENIPNELNKRLFKKKTISEVVDKLYDSRNYFIHGDKKTNYKNLVTDFNEMYTLQILCQEVLRYYIFIELGLEDYEEY